MAFACDVTNSGQIAVDFHISLLGYKNTGSFSLPLHPVHISSHHNLHEKSVVAVYIRL